MSAAAFARHHGLSYSTFCSWRERRASTRTSPTFVQVELAAPAASDELVIELGGPVRLRLQSTGQIELAARLLHALTVSAPC